MRYNFKQTTRLFFIALILCFGMSGLAVAQETTGSINGTVRDASGASVAGATVTITDPTKDNSVVRTLTTGEDGDYSAPNLQPGVYQITVEAPNFKKAVQTNIKIELGQRRSVDVSLEAGNISETVTIQADTVAVELSTPTAGTTITGDQVRELSVNNRNFVQLVTLAPGVSSNLADQVYVGTTNPDGQANVVSISVNGARSSQNTFTVDGADITDRGSNITIQAYPSVDSIGEFRVLRSLYPAESGRSGGGQINVVTRSGTDKFHGSLFEFVRNEKFNANTFFNNQRAPFGIDPDTKKARRAPFRYNNYGFTVGGPVYFFNFGESDEGMFKKYRKTYFFFSEEQRKDRRYPTLISSLPTADIRKGIFPIDICLSGAISGSTRTCNSVLPAGTPLTTINPVAQGYLTYIYNKVPLPNNPAVPFQVVAPDVGRADFQQEIIKFDTSITNDWTAFYRYQRDKIPTVDVSSLFSSGTGIPGVSTSETDSPGRTHTLQTTYIVSPKVIVEGRYTYAYGAILSASTGLLRRANSPINVNLPFAVTDDRIPTLSGNGFTALGSFGPYDNFSTKKDAGGTLTWIFGNHTTKYGGNYSRYRKHENALGGNNQGTFSGFLNTVPGVGTQGSVCAASQQTSTGACLNTTATNIQAFANFLLGNNLTFSQARYDLTADFRQQNFEAFAQDEWRLKENLTIYYGVRYSYFGSPWDRNGFLSNFDPYLFNKATAPLVNSAGSRIAGSGNFCEGLIINSQNVPSLLPTDCKPTVSPFGKYVVEVSKTNFAPRVGIAWDPFKKGKTAIRTGYGIYHEQTLVGTFEQNLGTNPPYQQVCSTSAVTFNNPDPTGGCQTTGFSVSQTLRAVDPDYKTPYMQHWSLDWQQQLDNKTVFTIGYYGSKGTNLIGVVDINLLPPGYALTQICATGVVATPTAPCQLPGVPFTSSTQELILDQIRPYRGYRSINIIKPIFNSIYSSLQVSAKRRFAAGSEVNLAYTWAKNLTDSQTDRSSSPQNPYNIHGEYGRAQLDRRHVLNINYNYEIPFFKKQEGFVGKVLGGWQTSGIISYFTGIPFTITTSNYDPAGLAFLGPSASGPRPNQYSDPFVPGPVPANPDPLCQLTISQKGKAADQVRVPGSYFNPCAFQTSYPTSGVSTTPGTAGRGVVDGPHTFRVDMTLSRNFRFGEDMRFQFRAEAFNIFNRTNFTTFGTNPTTPSSYAIITGTRDPRTLQFGLKFYF